MFGVERNEQPNSIRLVDEGAYMKKDMCSDTHRPVQHRPSENEQTLTRNSRRTKRFDFFRFAGISSARSKLSSGSRNRQCRKKQP